MIKHLKNKKSRRLAASALKSTITALENAVSNASFADTAPLQTLLDYHHEQLIYLNGSKSWLFNFTSGGWNSIMAVTQAEAIKAAREKYSYTDTLNPDPNTFRLETESEYRALMAQFY